MGADLAAAGARIARVLTPRALSLCLGTTTLTAVPRVTGAPPMPCPPAAAPIWLWCVGRPVPRAPLVLAVGEAALAAACDLDLCVDRGDAVHPRLRLAPLGRGLVVYDLAERTGEDTVPWPDDSTLHLAGCVPPAPRRWLDLGTGPAALPLAVGAAREATRASDLNPRAVWLGELGAALAGRVDLVIAHADLAAGAGEGWTLVTMNAPIPAALAAAAPITRWHRGPDDLLARLWAAAPALVTDAGEVLIHAADDGERHAPPAANGGAVTIARYTPGPGPGFAVVRWRPHAPAARHRGVVALSPAHPFVDRADLDAIAAGTHVGGDLR